MFTVLLSQKDSCRLALPLSEDIHLKRVLRLEKRGGVDERKSVFLGEDHMYKDAERILDDEIKRRTQFYPCFTCIGFSAP